MDYQGKSVVEGIGIGRILLLQDSFDEELSSYEIESSDIEKTKYQDAVIKASFQLNEILDIAKTTNNHEQMAIMGAHLLMIQDPMLEETVNQYIGEGIAAPSAVLRASEEVAAILAGLEDEYLKERAADVKDIGKRLVRILLDIEQPTFEGDGIILCGEDIEPSIMANLSSEQVAGIVMGSGSSTSHAVIIAKAKGFVTLVGLGSVIADFRNGSEAIIDGYKGKLILEPNSQVLEEYQEAMKVEIEKKAYYLSLSNLPAVTTDGHEVTLAANIGNPKDIDDAIQYGCKGVGLFRTEFVFMGKKQLPTEDEQFEAYKYVIERVPNDLCVIRTMDIGGDKPLDYLAIDKEENPFLGWRAIRICLERTDIFLTQIRAILRASVYGKVAIMIPMIINIEEIREAKALIQQAKDSLDVEEIKYSQDIQIGIMVETPAAAVMSPVFAEEVDFFSIGTNDLVQYTLAVDRGNQKVSYLYSHFNSAIIRLIAQVVEAAHAKGKWVGVCGEMGSDPLATRMFVEMGIDELSMSAPSIPKVKEVIRSITKEGNVLQEVLKLNEASKIKEFLAGTVLANNINDTIKK